MVALLNEPPRSGPGAGPLETGGCRRRGPGRRPDGGPVEAEAPAVPPVPSRPAAQDDPPPTQDLPAARVPAPASPGWTDDHGDLDAVLAHGGARSPGHDSAAEPHDGDGDVQESGARRKLVVIGLPVLALAIV